MTVCAVTSNACREQKRWALSMARELGSLAIFKETLPCRKHIRWEETSVDIDYDKKQTPFGHPFMSEKWERNKERGKIL